MPMFRKKPVEIEAHQINTLDYDGMCEILAWCGATPRSNDDVEAGAEAGPVMTIHTLEGDHAALDGDWIIKGVAGEFYPCKNEIFAATYDAV